MEIYLLRCVSLLVAHHDRPPFSGRPSLTGHCGHGWTCSLPRPVAIDPFRQFAACITLREVDELNLRPNVLSINASAPVPACSGHHVVMDRARRLPC
jgi:hypothetical protein